MVTRNTMGKVPNMMSPLMRIRRFGSVERRGESLLFTKVTSAIPESRLTDSSRAVAADKLTVLVFPKQIVNKKILRDDGIPFHTEHLGNMRDAARTVAKTGGLDDYVDRGH